MTAQSTMFEDRPDAKVVIIEPDAPGQRTGYKIITTTKEIEEDFLLITLRDHPDDEQMVEAFHTEADKLGVTILNIYKTVYGYWYAGLRDD